MNVKIDNFPPVRVIKRKRKNEFESQRYRIVIDGVDIPCSVASAQINANNTEFTEVTITLRTRDFQWIDEASQVQSDTGETPSY